MLDGASIQETIVWLRDRFPALDGVVNAAYSGRAGLPDAVGAAEFLSAYQLNVVGPTLLIMNAVDLLSAAAIKRQGGAAIVNIASMYGTVSPDLRIYADGRHNPLHYGTSKAAMLQMTRYLACHLASNGIRVNAVSPGPFPRPELRLDDESFYKTLESKVPLGRLGRAAEVAGPVVFLLSDAAAFVTGANIAVDGGWTSW